ncbi:MAG: hypothetical protein CME27_04680 [Gemmatimonadetes bacterium]|nr:hypothetical protein [Gemmatimonadota bacterium]
MSTVAVPEPGARVDIGDSRSVSPKKLKNSSVSFYEIGVALLIALIGSAGCHGDDPRASSLDPQMLTLEDFPAGKDHWSSIRLADNPRVEKWVNLYRGVQSNKFADLLVRKKRFDEIIQTHLQMRGMPRELVFIPMIESEYLPQAVSPASAVGLWQFMGPTAEHWGLRLDPFVDERRDPVRATEAALDYFSYLHQRFGGSWYLAAAAFNAGPGRLERVLLRHAADKEWDDALFWEIDEYLPRETREYVPKMIAVARLAREVAPRESQQSYITPYRYDNIFVPGGTALLSVADALGVDLESILALNPHLTRRVTPPNEMHAVRVPVGTGAVAVAGLSGSLPLVRADD